MEKTQKQIQLDTITAQLDAFPNPITSSTDYDNYRALIVQENFLQREVLAEKLVGNVQSSTLSFGDFKLQNRTIDVQISFNKPVPATDANPDSKVTINT